MNCTLTVKTLSFKLFTQAGQWKRRTTQRYSNLNQNHSEWGESLNGLSIISHLMHRIKRKWRSGWMTMFKLEGENKTFRVKFLLPRVAQITSKSTALDIIFIRFLFLSCHWQWKNLCEYCLEEKKTFEAHQMKLVFHKCDHRSLKLRGYWSAGY